MHHTLWTPDHVDDPQLTLLCQPADYFSSVCGQHSVLQCASLAHVQLGVEQNPSVLLCKPAI